MSQLLRSLVSEHERVLEVLSALQQFASLAAPPPAEPRETLRAFVRFFREYLDQKHHAKEEDLLFPALIEAGMPRDAGPVGCMLHEHESGRRLLANIATISEGTGAFTELEQGMLAELARQYVPLLTQHIAKENQMLYPMAARLLSADQFEELDATAVVLDARWTSSDGGLEAVGATLVARFSASASPAERAP